MNYEEGRLKETMEKKYLIMPSGFLVLLMILIAGTFLFQPVVAATIDATVVLDPEKFNLSNPPADWTNPYVVATIGFPKAYKNEIKNIDPSTVLLDGVIPLSRYIVESGKFKSSFDKDAVINYLWTKVYHMGYVEPFKNIPIVLTVTGNLYDGTSFGGSDTVYVSGR